VKEKIFFLVHPVSFDQLMADERTKDVIFRNLEVIGEASIVRGTTISCRLDFITEPLLT
jgi:uncharacterized protein with HEPN domain